MKILTVVGSGLLLVALSGCGSALRLGEELGVTARDAFLEGRTRAVTWDSGARLRWIEGVDISAAGAALPGEGQWRLHYTAPGRTQGLVVTVTSLESGSEEQAPASPSGLAIGDESLGETWLNSPAVLVLVSEERAEPLPQQISMLLVPTRPAQWVVNVPAEARTWRLDARTGEVLTR